MKQTMLREAVASLVGYALVAAGTALVGVSFVYAICVGRSWGSNLAITIPGLALVAGGLALPVSIRR